MNTYQYCKLALTVSEACHAIGIGRTKLYELVDQGKLEKKKIGRRTLITSESLSRLIAEAGDT